MSKRREKRGRSLAPAEGAYDLSEWTSGQIGCENVRGITGKVRLIGQASH